MKYIAPLNAGIALSSAVVNLYYQDLGTAAAWFSSFLGWSVVSAMLVEKD